jgi:hypothetical protein
VLSRARFIDFEEIMSFAHWLTAAALASLPFAAIAEQKHHQADPTDASAAVPASGYESAFKNYRAAADEQESPEKVWRAANDEMGKVGGHAGHIKDDSTTPSAAGSAQAKPADHRKHH